MVDDDFATWLVWHGWNTDSWWEGSSRLDDDGNADNADQIDTGYDDDEILEK